MTSEAHIDIYEPIGTYDGWIQRSQLAELFAQGGHGAVFDDMRRGWFTDDEKRRADGFYSMSTEYLQGSTLKLKGSAGDLLLLVRDV